MKKKYIIAATGLALIGLATSACSSNNNSSNSSKSSSSKVNRPRKVVPSDKAKDRTWTYKDKVFDAGIETYKFTKSEVRDSATDGKKILVLYCDVTNNSTKEQDPSNVYMVVHAYQKTDTSNVQLDTGMSALDDNGDNPLQTYEDNLNNKLLPGKTVKACLAFELKNDNPVTVKFDNSNFDNIGQEVYDVK
jgi:hypothetical protein